MSCEKSCNESYECIKVVSKNLQPFSPRDKLNKKSSPVTAVSLLILELFFILKLSPQRKVFKYSLSSFYFSLKAFADHRRKLRPARKHAPTSNPIKARQKREDLRTETDVRFESTLFFHLKQV